MSRGKKYYFKCVGTAVQKQSWWKWKRSVYILCKRSCVANALTRGRRLQLVKGSLAGHPGQVRLDSVKLFATFMGITEGGRWAALLKMKKMGKFLLNYFIVKISVKEFSGMHASLLENKPTQSYLYGKAVNIYTDESTLNNNYRFCRYLGRAGQDFKKYVA